MSAPGTAACAKSDQGACMISRLERKKIEAVVLFFVRVSEVVLVRVLAM